MKLRELKQIIDSVCEHVPDYAIDEIDVVVPIKGNGIGGTACTHVRSAYKGFDWDHGKFMLFTEDKVQKIASK